MNNSPHSSKINSIIGIDPNLENLDNPVWAKDSNCFFDNSLSSTYKADIILAMDVLEHIKEDHAALKEWRNTLKPDGLLLITVPAFQHLWSSHDIFLGHYKRYNNKSLNDLANSAGLEAVRIHLYFFFYISFSLFPSEMLTKRFQ